MESKKKMDNPHRLNTDKDSMFELQEEMQTVDPLPVEELKDNVKDEKDTAHTKNTFIRPKV